MKAHIAPYLLLGCLVALLFSGCASIENANADYKEKFMLRAGFVSRPADTPAKQAQLQALRPYRMHMAVRNGTLHYVYPDPAKQVLLTGGPIQYGAYKKLYQQQNLKDDEMFDAMDVQQLQWEDWGY